MTGARPYRFIPVDTEEGEPTTREPGKVRRFLKRRWFFLFVPTLLITLACVMGVAGFGLGIAIIVLMCFIIGKMASRRRADITITVNRTNPYDDLEVDVRNERY